MMKNYRKALTLFLLLLLASAALFAQSQPVDLQFHPPFRFVIYGDTRFHDPKDTEAANPAVRQALVQAIDAVHPAFISIGGDIVYNGDDANDWKTWDAETSLWRQHHIPVYPVLGNHDLHGDQKVGLGYFFQRFPDLHESRYYSVRSANTLLLVLDSSQDETSGPQGNWLNSKLDRLPADVDFVFILLHHPPYTSSSDEKKYGGGHSARPAELAFAKMLEGRQSRTRARFVLFGSHVHNYERHAHNGVTYFVTGGGGAHAYPIERAPEDPFQSKEINFHYLLIDVDHSTLTITMNRIELVDGKAHWSQPDSVTISAPSAAPAKASAASD